MLKPHDRREMDNILNGKVVLLFFINIIISSKNQLPVTINKLLWINLYK